MKRTVLLILILSACSQLHAQQTSRYTQYTFNNIGLNPAYAGTYLNKTEVVIGRRNQWYGFDGAPVTTFAGATYGYRPNRAYKVWHGFSTYVEESKTAQFSNKSAYLGYACHFRLFTGVKMSFGLMAGLKSYGLSSGIASTTDPAFNQSKSVVYTYPDIIPGFRMYSSKMFFDVSVRQLYPHKISSGKNQLGTPSKLDPTYYMTLGRKFVTGYHGTVVVPSVHVQSVWKALPQVDLNCMVYYYKRIGVGLNYRVNNAVSGILQVSILPNLVAGFSYDYTTTRLRNASSNTYEFMIGLSPVMMSEDKGGRKSVAQCPTFEF